MILRKRERMGKIESMQEREIERRKEGENIKREIISLRDEERGSETEIEIDRGSDIEHRMWGKMAR